MAVISKFGAVVKIGRIEMTGFVAWLAWLGLHLVTLTGFKARITTLAHWTIAFVSNARSERVTTRQQLVSRLAVKQLGDAYQPTITGTLDPTVLDERVDARNRRDTRPQEIWARYGQRQRNGPAPVGAGPFVVRGESSLPNDYSARP